jgi:ABC-type multidrug transport system fused ATPase/permease subunit
MGQARALLGGRLTSVAALVVASVLSGLSEATVLAIIAQVAGALVDGAKRVHADIGSVHLSETVGGLLAIGFGLAVVRLVLQVPLSTIPARMSADVQARLGRDLFGAYTRASWTEQSRDREGQLQELVTNQALQASYVTASATQLVTSGLTLLVLMLSALLLNVVAAVVVVGATVLMFGLLRPLNHFMTRWSRGLSRAQMSLASGVGQAARLAEETHVFGVAAAQRRRMDEFIGSVRVFSYRTQTLGRLSLGVYQSFIYLLVVGGLAVLSASHAGHVASLGAVVLLLVRAGGYGLAVQGAYQGLRQSMPFVERVQEAARRYAGSVPVTGDRRLREVRTLTFENVGFAYTPGRPVLSDISFEVTGGEAIGVVGPSGAGKSTLVQLLLQLRAADRGRYLVNGVAAELFARDDWHARVSYVPQEPRLLHASVADNIRYFRDLDDGAVEEAAKAARIDADILTWASGYETIIGPRADAVSGGQQQRICIARALATQPQVLVLDEPTSALDPRSESLLQESLLALRQTITLFVIAHRMSTLSMCDRVMVIVDGKLEAFDTATRLRQQSSYYRTALAIASGSADPLPS